MARGGPVHDERAALKINAVQRFAEKHHVVVVRKPDEGGAAIASADLIDLHRNRLNVAAQKRDEVQQGFFAGLVWQIPKP